MRIRTPKWTLLAATILLVASSASAADNFVLVRNTHNPVTTLSKTDVRKLFTGRSKQWSSGKVFQGVIGELDTPEFVWLATAIFGMSPKDLLTKMKQEIFRGEMKRPIVVKSSDQCIEVVQSTETALCVATETSARALPPEVQTIRLSD
jgi:hypothetical protein